MATEQQEKEPRQSSFLGRLWRALATPSARWSVLALVIVGYMLGAYSSRPWGSRIEQ